MKRFSRGIFLLVASGLWLPFAHVQQPAAHAQQSARNLFGQEQKQGSSNQSSPQARRGVLGGAQGGAAQADFDSLIDLIQSTVSADSWMENGTGEGEVQPFPNGVYADAQGAGLLRMQRRPSC